MAAKSHLRIRKSPTIAWRKRAQLQAAKAGLKSSSERLAAAWAMVGGGVYVEEAERRKGVAYKSAQQEVNQRGFNSVISAEREKTELYISAHRPPTSFWSRARARLRSLALAARRLSKPEIFCKTSYTKPPSNPDFQKKWEQEITKYEASQISSDPSSEVPTPVDPRIEVAKAGITASQRLLERAWTAILPAEPPDEGREPASE